jgi:hypothetical protein
MDKVPKHAARMNKGQYQSRARKRAAAGFRDCIHRFATKYFVANEQDLARTGEVKNFQATLTAKLAAAALQNCRLKAARQLYPHLQ